MSARALALVALPEAPVISFSPASGAVVQLPTIISGASQTTFTKDVDLVLPGFPTVRLAVTATPHFHFDLGDGTSADRDDTGTAYDGTDPVEHPDHYLTVTYHRLGTKTVTLTVTWTATAKRADTGATLTLDGSATRTSTVRIPVHEARAVLSG